MKRNRKEKTQTEVQTNAMAMKPIQPKTENQSKAFKNFKNKNLLLHGLPGTGKTFIALYLAIKAVLAKEYRQVVIIRSAVATRDIGFMPGNATEKMKNYESPYYSIVNDLFGRGDAYDILKNKKQIVFMPTSFIRGVSLDDTILIVDEAQNMTDMELHSVITRIGNNSKLIICGDVRQDDLTSERFKELSGLGKMMKILKSMDAIYSVEFMEDDIVRSDFLKEYIIARYKFESKTSGASSQSDSAKLPSFIQETVRSLQIV